MKLPAFIKTYDGVTVLDFPGMEIEPGKIYAVIGANGSGKSTFAKILSGVLPADRKVQLPQSVGYLPQKPYAFRMSTKKIFFWVVLRKPKPMNLCGRSRYPIWKRNGRIGSPVEKLLAWPLPG